MRRKRRNGLLKERILMAVSAVLVLGSLTATGLWLGKSEKNQEEDYVVDLNTIENNTTTSFVPENEFQVAENVTQDLITSDDLDYDPYFQETNSGKVKNPDESESESMSEGVEQAVLDDVEQASAEDAELAVAGEEAKMIPESPALVKEKPEKAEEEVWDAEQASVQ